MGEGYGSAIGRLTSWLHPIFDKRARLKRDIKGLEAKIEALEDGPCTPETSAKRVGLEQQRNQKRQELEALRD